MRSKLEVAAMAAMAAVAAVGEMKSMPLINTELMSFGKLGKTYKKKNPYDPAFAKAQAKRDRKNRLRLERTKE